MRVWVESSFKNVFRNEQYGPWSDDGYEMVMAKNERESFQILLRCDHDFVIHSVTFSDLLGEKGKVDRSYFSYGYVEYEYLPENSHYVSAKDAVRTAPGWFPDAISNQRSYHVERKETQPIWITLYFPKEAEAGDYCGTITVHTNMGDYPVSLKVELCDVTIPDPDQAEFRFMIWQQIIDAHGSPSSRPTPIYREYGYKRWTPEWWEVVSDIADKMHSHRVNDLFVATQTLLLDGGSTLDEDGNYHFVWDKFDEYIEYFLKLGFIRTLIGCHLTGCYYRTLEHPVLMLMRDAEGKMCVDYEHDWEGEAAQKWMRQFLPALVEHLTKKNWIGMWYQHLGDECFTEEQMRNYSFISGELRKYPTLRFGDAVMDIKHVREQAEMGIGFVVPILETWEPNLEYFKELEAKGIEVYPYYCCGPIGSWTKCFIDLPAWSIRTLIWRLYGAGVKGYLCWSMNYWDNTALTEFQNFEEGEAEYKGDSRVLYPDPYQNKVRSSIRFELIRDGAEDFELLTILGKRDPEYAKKLADKIAINCNDGYSRDIKQMIAVRKELVRAAANVQIANENTKAIDPKVIAGFIEEEADSKNKDVF